jgi:hypothetical protein
LKYITFPIILYEAGFRALCMSRRGKEAPIEFVEKIVGAQKAPGELGETASDVLIFTELLKLAKDQGYDIQKVELREAFKTVSDNYGFGYA